MLHKETARSATTSNYSMSYLLRTVRAFHLSIPKCALPVFLAGISSSSLPVVNALPIRNLFCIFDNQRILRLTFPTSISKTLWTAPGFEDGLYNPSQNHGLREETGSDYQEKQAEGTYNDNKRWEPRAGTG